LKTLIVKKLSLTLIALVVICCLFLYSNSTLKAQSSITLSVPSVSGWTLTPGQINEVTRTIHVEITESTSWTVTASDSNTEQTNGQMTKYITDYVTDTKLNKHMQVVGPNGTATLPQEGTIITGTLDTDDDYEIRFRQEVEWTDSPANYRIVVTFTGTSIP